MKPFELTPSLDDNPGICIVTFSLENETNAALRSKLRRLIDRNDFFVVGTTLFEGVTSLTNLRQLVSEFIAVVEADQSGATLTNFEVWFMGTQRFSYKPPQQAA